MKEQYARILSLTILYEEVETLCCGSRQTIIDRKGISCTKCGTPITEVIEKDATESYCYKVVFETRDTPPLLVSSIVRLNPNHDAYVVNYKLNEWVRPQPNCGPLAVFSNLRDAQLFWETEFRSSRYKIFLAKYIPAGRQVLWIDEIERKIYRYAQQCPDGTLFANSVKLLEYIPMTNDMLYKTRKTVELL